MSSIGAATNVYIFFHDPRFGRIWVSDTEMVRNNLAACGKTPFGALVRRPLSARKSCVLGLCPVSAGKLFDVVGFAKQF
jgi:hypothetical protein